MLKIFRLCVAFLCCFCHAAAAMDVAISGPEARQWADSKGHELLQILSESNLINKYAKLDKMMTEDVNLDYISKFVIGKYAKLMDAQQKKQYSELFRRYVLSLYKKTTFSFNNQDIGFSIDSVTEYPKYTTVSCTVNPGQLTKDIKIEKIPVKFKLIRGKNNRIQAVDVEISDVSMVIEYRKRFYQMIKNENDNIEWFLERFNDKVVANEEAVYQKAGL